MLGRVVTALAVACIALSSCARAEAQPAPAPAPVPAPAPATPAMKPPENATWTEVSKRIGIPEATLRACKQTSDCTSMPHFTTCCSHVAVAKSQVAAIKKNRAKLDGMQTKEQEMKCSVVECSGATTSVACMQGWCVLDPYRATFTPIASRTGISEEALRACTSNEECVLNRDPSKCCNTIAIAKGAQAKVKALGDSLMTTQEREGCAIKKCGGGPDQVAICNEGICQLDFAP